MGYSWLFEDWPKTILALGTHAGNDFNLEGTAFVFQDTMPLLITAKHMVFDRTGAERRGLFAYCNTVSQSIGALSIDQLHDVLNVHWVSHPNDDVDIAAIPFPFNTKEFDLKGVPSSLLGSSTEIDEGDDLFFLGFPLCLSTFNKVKPVVRSGSVALKAPDKTYLIDGHIFPGNSGGPVFLKPSYVDIKGGKIGKLQPSKLIGIISSYLPYRDIAVSLQTERPRAIFEENSGLGVAFCVDYLQELLQTNEIKEQIQNANRKLDELKSVKR